VNGWRSELVGAIYKTMKPVFGQVYFFPAADSLNVVLVATRSSVRVELRQLQARAAGFLRERRTQLPTFRARVAAFRADPPASAARAPVLTDDFAPVEGLIGKE
jgi:hypothetical protein